MSDYSATFPSQRPVFSQDFAQSGKIDPRATFSRSDSPIDATKAAASAVHFWSNEKHISSDNLLLQSSDFDTTWSASGLNGTPISGQADPAGGTDGFTLVEDSSTGIHRISQNVTASGDLALTVYAKQNSGARYLTLALYNSTGNTVMAVYDLAGSAPVTASGGSSTFTSITTSQTASGDSYYKCVLKATGSATVAIVNLNDVATTVGLDTNWGTKSYTGDNSSSLDIAFASLTSTGATNYQATTTQIHREYAPTLKSVATAGAARFEYDPTDGQSAGTSLGILVEGQSTNLLAESTDFSGSWQILNASKSLEAIAPNGALNAIAFREGTNSSEKRLLRYYTGGGGSVTISIYAKLLGNTRRLVIREANASAQYATFDLATGTVVSGFGSIESVGNGWFRCQLNLSTTGTTQAAGFYTVPADGNYGDREYAGDGYSGLLLAHPQAEDQSHASSWISTTSSTATRAADSLSVPTSSFYTGGPVSVVGEVRFNEATASSVQYLMHLSNGTADNAIGVSRRNSGGFANKLQAFVESDNVDQGSIYVSSSTVTDDTDYKWAISVDTNDFKADLNGLSNGTSDTGVTLPTAASTLKIGGYLTSGSELDGHVKRVAVYGQSLSSSELAAITS